MFNQLRLREVNWLPDHPVSKTFYMGTSDLQEVDCSIKKITEKNLNVFSIEVWKKEPCRSKLQWWIKVLCIWLADHDLCLHTGKVVGWEPGSLKHAWSGKFSVGKVIVYRLQSPPAAQVSEVVCCKFLHFDYYFLFSILFWTSVSCVFTGRQSFF